MSGGNNSLRANRSVDLNKTGTLNGKGLQVTIRGRRRNGCSGRLEETPQALGNVRASTLCLEDQRSTAGGERRRHRGTGFDAPSAERERESREDVASWRGNGRLEVHVVGGSIGGEIRNEAGGGARNIRSSTALGERQGNGGTRRKLADQLLSMVRRASGVHEKYTYPGTVFRRDESRVVVTDADGRKARDVAEVLVNTAVSAVGERHTCR